MQERAYYSQCGEDYILWQLFKNQPKGFYVDVGAWNGMLFSNTYSFELAGWEGLCVEAHPHFFNQLQKNRPNATNINAAVGTTNSDNVPFYAAKGGALHTFMGALSTFSKPTMEYFAKYFAPEHPEWEVVNLPMYTLQSIFDQCIPAGTTIDFLSIDIEGTDLDALKALDLNIKWKPRVIISETIPRFDSNGLNQLQQYLSKFGYRFARCLKGVDNAFFCLEEEHERIIKSCVVNCQLVQTPMP